MLHLQSFYLCGHLQCVLHRCFNSSIYFGDILGITMLFDVTIMYSCDNSMPPDVIHALVGIFLRSSSVKYWITLVSGGYRAECKKLLQEYAARQNLHIEVVATKLCLQVSQTSGTSSSRTAVVLKKKPLEIYRVNAAQKKIHLY